MAVVYLGVDTYGNPERVNLKGDEPSCFWWGRWTSAGTYGCADESYFIPDRWPTQVLRIVPNFGEGQLGPGAVLAECAAGKLPSARELAAKTPYLHITPGVHSFVGIRRIIEDQLTNA